MTKIFLSITFTLSSLFALCQTEINSCVFDSLGINIFSEHPAEFHSEMTLSEFIISEFSGKEFDIDPITNIKFKLIINIDGSIEVVSLNGKSLNELNISEKLIYNILCKSPNWKPALCENVSVRSYYYSVIYINYH